MGNKIWSINTGELGGKCLLINGNKHIISPQSFLFLPGIQNLESRDAEKSHFMLT